MTYFSFFFIKVSSRDVFFVCGVIYLIFGIIGKFSAIFICIPYPVLGKLCFYFIIELFPYLSTRKINKHMSIF